MIHARIAHLLQEYLTTQLQIHYASLDRSIAGCAGSGLPKQPRQKQHVRSLKSICYFKENTTTQQNCKQKSKHTGWIMDRYLFFHRSRRAGTDPRLQISPPSPTPSPLRPNSGLRLPSILLASPAAAATPASQVQVARAPARGSGDGMLVYIEGEVGEELFSPRLMGKRTADMHSTTD
jgi:hypothetical protein